jgi:fructose-1,6-bisphosphatase/inositol monophosphatase family enzyme
MHSHAERLHPMIEPEQMTFQSIIRRIPEALAIAKIEAESSEMAKTPEGKFVATYLLATRGLLHPVLDDLQKIGPDFLLPIGGQEYNPERSIDEVGTIVVEQLAAENTDIPGLWIRSEESAKWQNAKEEDGEVREGKRFAVIDPLDMTSSIQKKDRVQTTGIAIYDRNGEIQAIGIASLVDHGFLLLENENGTVRVFKADAQHQHEANDTPRPLRIATLTRRMHKMRQLPLFTEHEGIWAMDCTSGYSILGLAEGNIDAVIDPFKGNPWYEVAIWIQAAKQLGFSVSDKDGNPLDIAAGIRRMIERHEGDSFRIPFVVSRTPEIHARVLSLLREKEGTPA